MKTCWQRKLWIFDYGWDDSFGTGIIRNSVSLAVSIRGYWIGVAR